MNTIIINCHRAPNLFSSLLSYFCTSTHSAARLTLMKCIGEAVRCWDGDYISGKNDDIVNIVLNGVKDRSGDVRDVSRIVLCYLYLRSLPSAPSSPELTEIDRISVIPKIPRSVLNPQPAPLSCPAVLAQQRRARAHPLRSPRFPRRTFLRFPLSQRYRGSPNLLALPVPWPDLARPATPSQLHSRSRSPSPQPSRVRGLATTPIKAPRRITVSPAVSPVAARPLNPLASRLLAATQPVSGAGSVAGGASSIVTVEQLEAQERQRVAVLPQLAWTGQLEVLRGMKGRLEGRGRAQRKGGASLEEAAEGLFHAPVGVVVENVTKTAGSAVLRVTSASLEVLGLLVRVLLTRENVEDVAECMAECVKQLVNGPFMSAENANSRMVVELINELLRLQCGSLNESLLLLFTHSVQTASLSASSPTFLHAAMLRFIASIVAFHPDLLASKPDLGRFIVDACYQSVLTNSTVLLRLVRDLLAQLAQSSPRETANVLQALSTSKKTVFLEFAEKFKLDETFVAALKAAKKPNRNGETAGSSPDRSLVSTFTLSKPVHFEVKPKIQSRIPFQKADLGNSKNHGNFSNSGNSNNSGYSDLSTTFEESEEPSLPRSASVLPIAKAYVSPQLMKRVGSHVQPVEKRVNEQSSKGIESQSIRSEKQRNIETQIDGEEALRRLQAGQGGKSELDCMVQAISKRQFCSLLSFNQLWNAPSPFLVTDLVISF